MAGGSSRRGSFSSNVGIQIDGLSAFQKALRTISEDREWTNELKELNIRAAEAVVKAAEDKASTGTERKVISLRGIRAGRSARSAYVAIRNAGRTPFAFGAEFGSKRYHQFRSWRGNQWGGWEGGPGYMVHPAIREKGRQILDEYMKGIDALTDKAFPEGS